MGVISPSPDKTRLVRAIRKTTHIFVLTSDGGSLRRHWIISCSDGEPVALEFSPDAKSLLVVSFMWGSSSGFDQSDLFSIGTGEQIWHQDNDGIYTKYSIGISSDRPPDFAAFSCDGTRVAIGGSAATNDGENFLEVRRASDGKILSLTNKPNDVLPLAYRECLR